MSKKEFEQANLSLFDRDRSEKKRREVFSKLCYSGLAIFRVRLVGSCSIGLAELSAGIHSQFPIFYYI